MSSPEPRARATETLIFTAPPDFFRRKYPPPICAVTGAESDLVYMSFAVSRSAQPSLLSLIFGLPLNAESFEQNVLLPVARARRWRLNGYRALCYGCCGLFLLLWTALIVGWNETIPVSIGIALAAVGAILFKFLQRRGTPRVTMRDGGLVEIVFTRPEVARAYQAAYERYRNNEPVNGDAAGDRSAWLRAAPTQDPEEALGEAQGWDQTGYPKKQ
ncbi:MAG: hypothetical protein ACREJ2_14530 [Planctomycetota bacterium]